MGLSYGAGSVQVGDGGLVGLLSRNVSPQGMTGVGVTEGHIVGAGGRDLAISAARTLTAAEIAAAAAAVGAAAYAGVSLGAPVAKWFGWTDADIGDTRCIAGNTGWHCDSGQAATVTEGQGWFVADNPQTLGDSKDAACAAMNYPFGYFANNVGCYAKFSDGSINESSAKNFIQQTITKNTCPAFTDALNPAYSKPAGEKPDADGKCPTGRYNDQTNQQVAKRLEDWGKPENMPDVVKDLLANGHSIETASPRTLSGPSSVTGTPTVTTTTNPDGSTSTATTTPTTNYTYNNSTVNYTFSTTTTTVNNSTGQTTTTSTGTTPQPDPEDPCVKNPGTVGCMKVGDVPTDSPQWQTKDIQFAPEDLGMGGSCPPPGSITLPVHAWVLTWSYQPACEVAPVIRFGLLALTAVGCLLWILTVVRT